MITDELLQNSEPLTGNPCPWDKLQLHQKRKAQKEIKEKKRASSFVWFQKEVLLYIIKVLDD